MSDIQPLFPLGTATTPRPPSSLHAAALVGLWCQLAIKVAEANAHDLPDARSLWEQHALVEEEIATSYPEWDQRMIQLLVSESELLHDATGDPGSCLQCRHSRLTLPPKCSVVLAPDGWRSPTVGRGTAATVRGSSWPLAP